MVPATLGQQINKGCHDDPIAGMSGFIGLKNYSVVSIYGERCQAILSITSRLDQGAKL